VGYVPKYDIYVVFDKVAKELLLCPYDENDVYFWLDITGDYIGPLALRRGLGMIHNRDGEYMGSYAVWHWNLHLEFLESFGLIE
jgi:hypothetical protein